MKISFAPKYNTYNTPKMQQSKPSFGLHVGDYNSEIKENVAKTATEKLVEALREIVPPEKYPELRKALTDFYGGLYKGSSTGNGIFEGVKKALSTIN